MDRGRHERVWFGGGWTRTKNHFGPETKVSNLTSARVLIPPAAAGIRSNIIRLEFFGTTLNANQHDPAR